MTALPAIISVVRSKKLSQQAARNLPAATKNFVDP